MIKIKWLYKSVVATSVAMLLLAAIPAQAQITYRSAAQANSVAGGITFVAAGSYASNNNGVNTRNGCTAPNNTISPPTPAGLNGEFLIALVASGDSSTLTVSAGWNTLLANNPTGSLTSRIYWRIANGTASDNLTVTKTGGGCNVMTGQVARFRGVDPVTPFDHAQPIPGANCTAGGARVYCSYQNTNSVTSGNVTTATASAMTIFAVLITDNNTTDASGSGFTEVFDSGTSSGNDVQVALSYRQETTAGLKAAVNVPKGGGSDPNHGVLFALRPAPAPAAVTIAVPAGTILNDVMIASIAVTPCSNTDGAACTTTITPPAGWTQVGSTIDQTTGATAGFGNRLAIYRKVATATEPANYTWSFGGTPLHAGAVGGITTFSGVDTVNPIDAQLGGVTPASNSTHTAPEITTTVADTMLVGSFAVNSSGTWPTTAPMTQALDVAALVPNSDSGISLTMAYEAFVGPGATGTRTATASTPPPNDTGTTHLLALRPAAPPLNHIRIEHTGTGLTCEPATMTIKACADATCATPYTGAVTTTLSPTGWVGGDTINFTSPTGATTAQLRRTTVGPVTLGAGTTTPVPANPTRCFNGLSETCNFNFVDTGFIFSAIPTQIAATTSATHTLQAVRTDLFTGVCTGLFTGNVPNIELASECINPATCQAGQQVTFNNNGSGTIAANNGGAVGSWTTRTLTFGANSTANFTFSYPDVGAIRLHARYNIASSGNYMTGVTTPAGGFVVRPAGFTVTGIQRTAGAFANPAAADASGLVFIKAGDAMTLTVTAVSSLGIKTPNYGKESVPEGVLLTSALVPGLGLTNNPALGNGTVAGGAFGVGPNAGIATVTNVSWGDVGIIRITPSVGDGSYLGTGDVTGTTTGNIGRFTPHNFNVTPVAPLFTTACTAGSFTYVGQPFIYAGGMNPVLTVTARNQANGTTLNYKGTAPAANAFFKITNAKLAQVPYAAQTDRYTRFDALGGGTTPALDVSGLPATTADPAIVDNANGTATLTFGSGTGLAFARTTPVAPYNADISLAINVIDTDDVVYAANPARFGTATAGNGMAFSAGKNMRFGQLRLISASGSQLLPLRVPAEAQYWNGTFWITNVADSCTTLASANVGIGNVIGGIATSVTAVTSPLSAGRGSITLAKPAGGASGSVDIAVNLGAGANADACTLAPAATAANRAYLRGSWCNPPGTYTKDPAARARFGIRGGSDERIYMRENY